MMMTVDTGQAAKENHQIFYRNVFRKGKKKKTILQFIDYDSGSLLSVVNAKRFVEGPNPSSPVIRGP